MLRKLPHLIGLLLSSFHAWQISPHHQPSEITTLSSEPLIILQYQQTLSSRLFKMYKNEWQHQMYVIAQIGSHYQALTGLWFGKLPFCYEHRQVLDAIIENACADYVCGTPILEYCSETIKIFESLDNRLGIEHELRDAQRRPGVFW